VNARLLLLLFAFLSSSAFGQEGSAPDRFTITPDPDFHSLDEKIQSLKKDVLDLSKTLSHLQNELLTPASTKISVFVSLGQQDIVNIDSIQLQVDDLNVANYLYNPSEQEALRRGGVQRLYLGNITTGRHQLTASFIGKDTAGKEKRGTVNSSIEKTLAAKYVELKITKVAADAPQLSIKEWE
jgi:hypothetical protein